MMTIQLNDELGKAIKNMAESEHKPVEQVVNDALIEFLEDYHDTRTALAVMSRIESGEEAVLTLDEVECNLNAMDG
ncbi:MAG: DUF6290 family protein [Methylococcales bacterium]